MACVGSSEGAKGSKATLYVLLFEVIQTPFPMALSTDPPSRHFTKYASLRSYRFLKASSKLCTLKTKKASILHATRHSDA